MSAPLATPSSAAAPDRFAVVTLGDGSVHGAAVSEVSLAGRAFVRLVVLRASAVVLDVAPEHLRALRWCSQDEARAANRSPDDDTPTRPPPAPTRESDAPVCELREARVWMGLARSREGAQGPGPAEVAAELGADDIEVRASSVVFRVEAAEEARVRAALDARDLARVCVCPRCGCSVDRPCSPDCAPGADGSPCARCGDVL